MKVLVLSCNTGEGHNSAARAVCEALAARGAAFERIDALRFAGKRISPLVSASYRSIVVHTPALFGLMYKLGGAYSSTKLASPIYRVNARYAQRLYAYVAGNGFDAIVCTHLFPMEAITCLRRACAPAMPCCAVLTDYTCIPFFAEIDADAYCLPHADVAAECLERGMAKDKLFVTGIPVSGRFRRRIAKDAARNDLNIPQDAEMILIMTGGLGCGNVLQLCERLLRRRSGPSALFVLAGRNAALTERLKTRFGADSRVHVVPYTEKVHVYMCAADALITKPGGISSTEAAALNIPLVHAMPIPGCETRNAALFAAKGMALNARTVGEAAAYAELLLRDKEAAARMCQAQRQGIDPRGAEHVAALVARLCGE